MQCINDRIQALVNGEYQSILKEAYPRFDENPQKVTDRLVSVLEGYRAAFGEADEIHMFSAPGRVEVGGNHTDHQHGCVLAGAVDADTVAAASLNGGLTVNLYSEGYGMMKVDLSNLIPVAEEQETTASLIRGIAAALAQRGYPAQGFNAYVTSEVLSGSGISSSAAFEVLLGTVMNGLYCGGQVDPVQTAIIGQYAENVYFGKPSGLMDQMSSAVGAFVSIDFKDPSAPVIRKIDFDLAGAGLALYVINSGASHANLTAAYAEIPAEMKAVAACLGQEVLRDTDEDEFWARLTEIREKTGDRAVLRAIHYYEDHKRAIREAEMLEAGDVDAFLTLLNESGDSSFMHLQNVTVCGRDKQQEMAYALAVCKRMLNGRGACRIQGGGFAGTLQAFVPLDIADKFVDNVDKLLGEGACRRMTIRHVGCAQYF